MKPPYAFVCYSHEDAGFIGRVVKDLRAQNIQVWIDHRQIRGGREWWKDVTNAIKNATVFMPFLSVAAYDSVWVGREIDYADKQKGSGDKLTDEA